MSLLRGHTLVAQFERDKLLDLIQGLVFVRSTPLVAPFQFAIAGSAGGGGLPHQQKPANALDLLFRSVRLELDTAPPTGQGLPRAKGWLVLGIEAGVIRLPGAPAVPVPLGAAVRIALEFAGGGLPSVQLVSAHIAGVSSTVPDFGNRANALVNSLLDQDRDTSTKLFGDLPASQQALFLFSRPVVLDPQTLGLWVGTEDPAVPPVDRAVGNATGISLALGADAVRSRILYPSVLLPGETDPPPPGGGGALERGQDGVTVTLKRVEFAFRDGVIDVSGSFDANGDGWYVENGGFAQRLFFDFTPATQMLVPRMEPATPDLTYDVKVEFLVEALLFEIGLITPFIGSALLGFGAAVAANLIAEGVDPPVSIAPPQPQAIPPIPGVRWQSVQIHREGLLFRGDSLTERHLDAHDISRTSLSIEPKPENVATGAGGETPYRAPGCEERRFLYQDYTQDDGREVTVKDERLIEPIVFEWFVDDVPLSVAGSELALTTAIRGALPPPEGIWVTGGKVLLKYSVGSTALGVVVAGGKPPDGTVVLRARAADLCYRVRLDVRITDGAGRHFWNSSQILFEGVMVEFGADYHRYRDECLQRIVDTVDKKKLVKQRVALGEPQESVEWTSRYLLEHVAARSPEVQTIVPALTKAYGIDAVNTAIAKLGAPGG
jgi:hypothetical protein